VALAADYKQKQEAEKAQAAKPATPATPAPEKQDPAVQKAQQMAGLQAAIAAVDATATPQEAAQLKQWLYGVGDAVAKAAKEGDFFGIGGKQVSADEAAVLVEIKTALGL
jgi:DNA mismatch repair protein MutH